MKAIRLVIITCISCATICCRGQGIHSKKFQGSFETKVISKYDTFFPAINFDFLDHSNGLPKGAISDLVNTNDGCVWISVSHYGLVRYDGYHYRSFTLMQDDSTRFPVKNISHIVQGRRNSLWLVSDTGIICFYIKTFKSKVIRNIPKKAFEITNGLNCIEDNQGRLWILGNGLYIYDPLKQKVEEFNKQPAIDGITGKLIDISKFFFDSNQYQITLLKDGSFWIVGRSENVLSAMFHISPDAKSITCYLNNPWIFELLPDPGGDYLWASCSYSKTGRIENIENQIGRYDIKANWWLYIAFGKVNERESLKSYSLSHFENNKLWITRANLLRILDTRHLNCQLYENKEKAFESLKIVQDSKSNRWIWTEKNKLYYNISEANRFTSFKILPQGEKVVSYWKDEKNNIEWFGTIGHDDKASLYKYDLISHKSYRTEIPLGFCYPTVLTAFNDRELLVGISPQMYNSPKVTLYRFNLRSLSFQPISKKISNHQSYTTDSLSYVTVTRDFQNNIWLSSFQGKLLKYENKTNKFYLTNAEGFIRLGNIVKNPTNNFIWAGGKDLFKVDVQTRNVERFHTFLNSRFVDVLCEDTNGNLFIRLENGMAIFNSWSKQLYPVAGIPLTFKAMFDSKSNIIALAEDGLWYYDVKMKTAHRFDERDGLGEWNTFNLSAKDELIIDDIYRFPINFLSSKKEVPPLHLTKIRIAENELTTTNNVDTLNALFLKHDQNQLSFEFAALSFLPHDVNQYSCMLEGWETGWQQLGSNNTVTYANLPPRKYLFKVKTANQDGVWGKEKILRIIINPAFWQTVSFKVIIGLIIVAFSYWLYRNQLHQLTLKNQLEKEKLQQQQKEAEFEKRLADLTLSALRSQINPHFIFNCLNSIKLYATQNDIDAASGYLTKFSRLLRMVLDNSRNKAVPLADELEVLQLYIEMEAMRFKDKLKYAIDVKDLDIDYIEIPPMLLQPYVENAIWHGLMNKEGGGHLEITAAMKNDSILKITIKDDGIGRAKAAELKSKMATQHKSFGMEITAERLALINQIYKTATSITIDDLVDDEGRAAGTQVNIQIEIL